SCMPYERLTQPPKSRSRSRCRSCSATCYASAPKGATENGTPLHDAERSSEGGQSGAASSNSIYLLRRNQMLPATFGQWPGSAGHAANASETFRCNPTIGGQGSNGRGHEGSSPLIE